MIVETERPIKSEDLEGNEGELALLSKDEPRVSNTRVAKQRNESNESSGSTSSYNFDASKRSFTEEELKPAPIRNKEGFCFLSILFFNFLDEGTFL